MKLVSHGPRLIASLGDLVERDVTNDLTIEQTALIQLPPIPDKFLGPGITNNVQRQSFVIDQYATITNPGAQVANDICALGRGLWRIKASITYESNFVGAVRTAGFLFSISGLNINVALINIIACVGFQPMIGEWIFSLENDLFSLDYFLAAPPGAGNRHQAALCVSGEKLL